MGCGIKNSLGQNIVAKAAMGYAFSAIAPSRYSSDSLTIIDIAVLLFEDGYFQSNYNKKMIQEARDAPASRAYEQDWDACPDFILCDRQRLLAENIFNCRSCLSAGLHQHGLIIL
jgi:hypothetical protein